MLKRHSKPIDSHDAHFAIRVGSYAAAVAHLESKAPPKHRPEPEAYER